MSATEQQIIRRSVRLLAAVHELHKAGYQNLAIFTGMSGSGMHWRLQLCNFYDLNSGIGSINVDLELQQDERALHSSGNTGNQYFGWKDTTTASARELAEQIKVRFPRLVSQCKGDNFEYAGWFTYMLGKAEKGILPVMYRDYYSASKGFISSTGGVELIAPPHCKLHEINGRMFIYAKARHLTNSDEDWHTAYISIICAFRSANIAKFPLYPITEGNIKELGSYWEGAIYYIQHILGISRIDDFLSQLETHSTSSERWSSFFLIWDNFQQLVYLKAFLVRKMLMQSEKYPLKSQERKHWQVWIDRFEEENKDPNGLEPTFFNPYFGGSNPLHLGYILQEDGDNLFEL